MTSTCAFIWELVLFVRCIGEEEMLLKKPSEEKINLLQEKQKTRLVPNSETFYIL